MKIDSVFAISPVAFPEISPKIFGRGDETRGYAPEGARAASSDSSAYRLAPISISQNIHVIYLISPAK
jgi:hypothetical protein